MTKDHAGKPTRVWDLVQKFLSEKCTAHGFPRCRVGPTMGSIPRRLSWLVIAVCFTIYGSWQITGLLSEYFSDPTITTIDVVQQPHVPFPSVTFCPMQPFRVTSIEDYEDVFADYYQNFPDEKQAALWQDLVTFMKEEEVQMRSLSNAEDVLMNNTHEFFPPLSVEDLQDDLKLANISLTDTLDYFSEMQKIRRMSMRLERLNGENSIWTKRNAGRFLPWLNDTWNGKYFDMKQYFMSKYLTAPLTEKRYLDLFLEKNIDDFRASLRNGPKNPNARKQIQGILRFKNSSIPGDDLASYDIEVEARYYLQRFLFPHTYHQEDVVVECKYHGTNCLGQIYTTIHPRWRTCFHFNNQVVNIFNEGEIFQIARNRSTVDSMMMQSVGKEAGLTMRLRTGMPQGDLWNLNLIKGFVFAFSDAAATPRLDQRLIVTNDGYTDVAIKRTAITRLDSAYGGDCKHEDFFKVAFPDQKIIGIYDQDVCRQLLVFFGILSECGCYSTIDVMAGIIGIENLTSTYKSCSYDSLPCIEYATEQASNGAIETCPPACKEVKFAFSKSGAPHRESGIQALTAFENLDRFSFPGCKYQPNCTTAKFFTVNIFYSSPSVDLIEESLIYTAYGMVGNVGGLAGLYVGMSLISVLEFVELLYDIIIFVIKRHRKRHETSNATETSEDHHTVQPKDRRLETLPEGNEHPLSKLLQKNRSLQADTSLVNAQLAELLEKKTLFDRELTLLRLLNLRE